mmetsp:Transcript_10663/g.13217  ORF Transcript_10663/g.13217 Transcript_10663/m.13217 type:complete len:120 (+) Transcript_10663:81-440(+)|eukprot:CAMPEP_0170464228 /NCGR_PEP_ID=MMETSP0123-20130129/9034_1 /TAXON_ID=182087 /ORGANISM="Favella ehrenbergii, Strain Fehren 1" /LENGTH=119 /DNA_ID=CAMNT_0010729839 /DNA_START=81 /DNA_END=440 /DNA_ORIENTATION=+
MAVLNQDCIDKYQENAYMLGRIFSLDQGANAEEPTQTQVQGTEEKKADAPMVGAAGGEDAEEEDDDYELGELMNEIAAQNFSEKETVADEAMTGADDEVGELKEYLSELQAEFRAQKVQ